MYKKVRGLNLPNFMFWVLKGPLLFYYYFFKKSDYDVKLNKYNFVNEIRKTCLYYGERDKQMRSTVHCSYKINKYVISVKLRFHKKAKRQLYEDFRETLEAHTSNTTTIVFKRGYGYFDILLENKALEKFDCSFEKVSIGTGADGLFYWNWIKYPHLLLVGETGQGKSVFIRYLLNGLFSNNEEVWCIDGKVIDYTRFKDSFKAYEPNNVENKDKVLKLINRFRIYMYRRLDEMKELGIYEYQENKQLKPKFLLIDEFIPLIDGMNKEQRKNFEQAISDIALLGRACGYILVITIHRGDTKYISGALRDNFMCRIVVGNATSASYKMMFDESLIGFEIGKAWCMTGNNINVLSIPFYQDIIKCERFANIEKDNQH